VFRIDGVVVVGSNLFDLTGSTSNHLNLRVYTRYIVQRPRGSITVLSDLVDLPLINQDNVIAALGIAHGKGPLISTEYSEKMAER
jgi:hypothetical protein